jgi:hypothetical protein
MGGEPLLHPRLIEILTAARESSVADRVRLVTNGLLLPRYDAALWRNVDEVEISIYPGHSLSPGDLATCERYAAEHGVLLRTKYFDRFRETSAELGTDDAGLVARIYKTCNIAHAWSCHNVDDGYFYKCPQSVMLPLALDAPHLPPHQDGLKIEDIPSFAQTLLEYLSSAQPLHACRYCLGSVGKLFEHQQISRKSWRDPQRRTTEELLDREFLEVLEEKPGSSWLCTRGDLQDPRNATLVDRLGLGAAPLRPPGQDASSATTDRAHGQPPGVH